VSVRPYGPPIMDAIARGDARRLSTLVEQARTLHEQQGGDLSKAIKAGEAALKKLNAGGAKKAAPAKRATSRK